MSSTSSAATATAPGMRPLRAVRVRRRLALRAPRPELVGLLVLAGVLDLWALSRNGWANDYYSAAVRSMSTSWHNFLFASLDPSGVMTVDKPPLSLWVQALSVRAFGYHPLSILVPQALMGMATVALTYDLVRRRFGRLGGAVAGLALALTPITVAVSRHNNPDALLALCSVAALWCAVRALEAPGARRQTRWLLGAGVCVGLGFETKMGVALAVVPGIAAAWLWLAPAARGRLHALRQLLIAGAAMVIVGGAWPALVELTPAANRPWVSGTSDNTVLSLILEYNGVGRVDGQAGGPGGIGGGTMFGGSAGPLRLLNAALGGQDGWLLGFALVAGIAILAACRLRRSDPRSGWLLAVGGAFFVTAALFSFAGGIFHPYYVSLLAPFTAALVGAGAAQLRSGSRAMRIAAPLAIAAGVASELVVLGDYGGQLPWLAPALLVAGALAAAALAATAQPRVRAAALSAALAVLLIAPSAWAFDTLGHSANGTFPEGGPGTSALGAGAPFGARAGAGGPGRFGAPGAGGAPGGLAGPPGGAASPGAAGAGGFAARGGFGPAPGAGPRVGAGGGGGAPGGFGRSISSQVLGYVKAHGGGTIAVSSQSSAAGAIIAKGAEVAGIGGFSGRESDVSVGWLAEQVREGKIRWVLDEEGSAAAGTAAAGANGGAAAAAGSFGAFGPTGTTGAPGGAAARGFGARAGDSRAGSRKAMAAVAKACVRVSIGTSEGSASGASSAALYDCHGRAAALERTAA
jgi:4-amino-4-deoxy-L-arabinose transferase-like glycosyltransferase